MVICNNIKVVVNAYYQVMKSKTLEEYTGDFEVLLLDTLGTLSLCSIQDVISEEHYTSNITQNYKDVYKKIPDYTTFKWMLYKYLTYKDTTYYQGTMPFFIKEVTTNKVLPLVVTRDEQIHDAVKIIPTIFMEGFSSDITYSWLEYLGNDLQLLEFEVNNEGITNPCVDINRKCSRFKRHYKNLDVFIHTNFDAIIEKLQYYTPLAEEYWKQKGVGSDSNPDQSKVLDCIKHADGLVGIEVIQQDGAKGIGIFTIDNTLNEIYWDFSRRSVGSNIGNNIIYSGILYARKYYPNITHLNMGIGFYNWKSLWSTHSIQHPGLRKQNLNTEYNKNYTTLVNCLYECLPKPTLELSNPDRTVV